MDQNRVKHFLKDNLGIILILLFGLLVRIYYQILTKNITEWWDAAEYLSMALNWAFGIPHDFNAQRPILFPLIEAFLLKINASELVLRIVLEIIPSTLLILISYFIVKEMYNKRLALLVALFTSIFWLILFNTVRLHADILLLFFSYLGILFFWKGYVKKEKHYYIWLVGVFIALAFMTKLIGVLFVIIILIFLLITDKLKFLKNKHLWISLFLLILVILPYLIWQNNVYDNPLAFLAGSHVTSGDTGITEKPIAWYVFGWIVWMLHLPFFILAIIGLFTLSSLFLSLDLILKNKSNEHYNDLFIFIWIIVTLLYFVFIERDAEDRWLLPIALPLLVLVGKGLYFVYDIIKKYQKEAAVTIFILLVLIGCYFQLDRASETINGRKDSYLPVKEASYWIKENSEPDDIIFSKSVTQMTYYARREILGFGGNETEFKEQVLKYKPKYIVFSIFEVHENTLEYPMKFNNSLVPVQVYFADATQQQPILVIYEFSTYNL